MNPFIGQIRMFGGNFAPRNWALCNGDLLNIAQNTALFSLLGTTYGGDGRTTFKLPDLRGRAAMHEGSGPGLTPRRLGQVLGTETNTLNNSNLPVHNHNGTVTIHLGAASGTSAGSNAFLPSSTGANFYSPSQGTSKLAAPSLSVTTQNTGASTPVNNMMPYLVINYIIAMQGTYPSRS